MLNRARCRVAIPSFAIASALLAAVAQAELVTWSRGGGTDSWALPANWDTSQKPGTADNAIFTNTGLTPSKIISLDAAQTISTLTIAATTGFTIGADGTTSLSLANVTRQDVAGGTESIQTIAAPVVLTADSVWNIEGSNYLQATGGVSGGFALTKQGSGELRLGTTTYTGATTIQAGTLRGVTVGNLTIGDGVSSARFLGTTNNAIGNSADVTINANGTISLFGSEAFGNLIVNGGTFSNNSSIINGTITMTGGSIAGSGSLGGTHSQIITKASSAMAQISVQNNLVTGVNASYTVADGDAYVDLKVSGTLTGGTSGRSVTKSGAGVMSLLAGSTQADGTFSVSAGTLLVNNTTGSGTGQSAVSVAAGATLGGIGIIGGVSGYASANVSVSGAAGNLATLAPGDISETTGEHVIGTLTVGGAAQSNNVTLGGFSRLLATLSATANDTLAVSGNLTLNSTSSVLTLQTAPSAVLGAQYTLVTFSGTLTGRFSSATLDGVSLPSSRLLYRDSLGQPVSATDVVISNGSIAVLVPEPMTLSMASLCGAMLLARRRNA